MNLEESLVSRAFRSILPRDKDSLRQLLSQLQDLEAQPVIKELRLHQNRELRRAESAVWDADFAEINLPSLAALIGVRNQLYADSHFVSDTIRAIQEALSKLE